MGTLKIATLKALRFGERKSQYLDDIAILTGDQFISYKIVIRPRKYLFFQTSLRIRSHSSVLQFDNRTLSGYFARGHINLLSATLIREEVGLSLDKAEKEVLGHVAKVVLTKEVTTIVGDKSTQVAVNRRVSQIQNLLEVCFNQLRSLAICTLWYYILVIQVVEQDYEKEKLNKRIAKHFSGVAVIQVSLD
ncbi:hypothetical protein GIB67_016138 [Kingdonia uniflora]|uniref:Uncharacterized protein n=1 Tax=Kingdonia uniflora TaxID=39325 RepID=A0A7J7NAA4_9MAGN|nr:hypothetical protein GIB67_016138 [Kingdonia uniflora]